MPKEKTTKSKPSSLKSKVVNSAIKKLYDKSAPLLICEAIVFVVVAVLVFFKPVAILATVTFILGIALVLFGLYQACVALFGEKKDPMDKTLSVVFGIINIAIGVIFCLQPAGSMITVIYIFALLFLFKAIKALIFSIKMAKYKFGHYVLDILMSVILIALSVMIIFFPIAGAFTVMYYLALVLLLYAGADIHMYLELRRLKKSAA